MRKECLKTEMNVIGVIPARYNSKRLPGKPLKEIAGYPMLWWVYQRARQVEKFNRIIVATDDERIEKTCENYGIPVCMTDKNHLTAANRLQEVSEIYRADFYVQINGDEPLINVDALREVVPKDVPNNIEYGTNIITEINDPAQVMDPSNIKVVFDNDKRALYMSRMPIPFPFTSLDYRYYKHVGIIGYNKKMLDFYKKTKPGKFETIEGIDTLRFIDYGKHLQFIYVRSCRSLSVDTEKDLEYIRRHIKNEYE